MGFIKTLSAASVDTSLLTNVIQSREYPLGRQVIEQGAVNNNIYIINSGLIKLVYHQPSGTDYTKCFIEPNVIFASLSSTLAQQPSRFSAICLTSVTLERIPASEFEELARRDQAMQSYFNQMLRNLALRNEEREYDFLCLTAEERYEKFVNQSPHIANKVTQIEIAAYLGITPVALSRIRARRTQKAS